MAKGAELFRQLLMRGFPSETATRIVSGDLPMENAERVARGQERFDMDSPLYHGGSSDFTEFDADLTSTYGDFGRGIYMSDSPQEVSDFYAGPSEFRAMKVPQQEESNINVLNKLSHEELVARAEGLTSPRGKKFVSQSDLGDMDKDTLVKELAFIEAKDKLVGNHAGAMYELVIDRNGVVDVTDPIVSASEAEEYYKLARQRVDQLNPETITAHFDGPATEDDIEDLVDYFAADFAAELNPAVKKIKSDAAEMGISLDIYPGETDWTDIRHGVEKHINEIEMMYHTNPRELQYDPYYNKLPKNPDYPELIEPMRDGPITQELMKGVGIKGVRDTTAPDRFGNLNYPDAELGNHTIMFPGSENQIRSPQAAFDPDYKGGNMLGNADPRLLAGVGAAGVGVSALMNQQDSQGQRISTPKQTNDYGMMERLAAARAVQQRGTITNVPMTHREQAKQAWVEQGVRDGSISSNYSGQRMADSINVAADFIPWVGGAAGGADTYDSLSEGKYGQALFDGGTTLAGAIPVASRAARFTRGMLDQAARSYQVRKNNRSAKLMEEIVNQVAKDQ